MNLVRDSYSIQRSISRIHSGISSCYLAMYIVQSLYTVQYVVSSRIHSGISSIYSYVHSIIQDSQQYLQYLQLCAQYHPGFRAVTCIYIICLCVQYHPGFIVVSLVSVFVRSIIIQDSQLYLQYLSMCLVSSRIHSGISSIMSLFVVVSSRIHSRISSICLCAQYHPGFIAESLVSVFVRSIIQDSQRYL